MLGTVQLSEFEKRGNRGEKYLRNLQICLECHVE